MAQILAITNQKGGVGKTTTTVNLSASLAAMKRKVLMIDLDPQGNATMGAGVDKHAVELSIYDVLVGNAAVGEATVHSETGGFDLLPSNGDLTAAEVELLSISGREYRLRTALKLVSTDYDFILIDCPPSLNMLTVNALSAADGVIIPMQCEYYALEGLSALMATVNRVAEVLNEKIEIVGLLRTMYDGRNSLSVDVSRQLADHFGKKLYNTVIPRNVRLAEAPSYGMPALLYDKGSKGAMAYLALAGEVLRKHKK